MRLVAFFGIVALLLIMLNGCSTVAPVLQEKASQIADGVLASGKYNSCVAPTLGAIERKYKGNPGGLRDLANFCWERGTAMHVVLTGMADAEVKK